MTGLKPSPAMLVALAALFVALGSSSVAAPVREAATRLITGQNVKNSSLTGTDVKNSSLTSADVKNRSLLAQDFKAGQLPQGAKGDTGPKGDKGDKGDPGPLLDTLPPGRTLRGTFAALDKDAGQAAQGYGSIAFPVPLASAASAHVITDTPNSTCQGTAAAPSAAPGHLCLYVTNFSPSAPEVFNPVTLTPGSSRYGAVVSAAGADVAYAYGTWAVTAP